MRNFFVSIQHDNGTDYLKTTAVDTETLRQNLPNTLNCPPNAIKKVVEVSSYEFELLPASTIATASGLFKLVLEKCNCKYGAPMGRPHVFDCKLEGYHDGKAVYQTGKTFDRKVQLDSGGYDKGGAYWGIGPELRVTFNSDLTYIHFYRKI